MMNEQFEESIIEYEKVLDIEKEAYSEDDISSVESYMLTLEVLATLYLRVKDYEAELYAYEKILTIRETHTGSEGFLMEEYHETFNNFIEANIHAGRHSYAEKLNKIHKSIWANSRY